MRDGNGVERRFCGMVENQRHALMMIRKIKTNCSYDDYSPLLLIYYWVCAHADVLRDTYVCIFTRYQLYMLWNPMQWSALYFWAAELSAWATLMAMWWIRIQARSSLFKLQRLRPLVLSGPALIAHSSSVKVAALREPLLACQAHFIYLVCSVLMLSKRPGTTLSNARFGIHLQRDVMWVQPVASTTKVEKSNMEIKEILSILWTATY